MIDGSYSIFGFGSLARVIAKFLAAQNILVESFIVEDSFRNGDVDGNANCLSVSEFAQKKDFMKKGLYSLLDIGIQKKSNYYSIA